ncbi:TetR/AcrR family transcriptional regulator [Streptomyces albipurpureus]|uniref:TetR family transcriptional regulator n=1 Tax=Streptomyces albipurpureus TaxID=2897419 RepID=A0ABT0ULW7_9ACTN|nr:TetR family transcriptional regulator [Streptomyces sp. CWNU-1]MCM2389019.1 TetR family transcriptional regulator [Streptomyces sp. CWNU-1]
MAHVTAAERRPQLIAAAIELMAREGVAAGSTRAIAAELGVAQATVHYTFGTKADLYRAVLESLSEGVLNGVQEGVERASSLEEALEATAEVFWDDFCRRPDLNLLWFELITFALRRPELREVVRKYHQDMADIAINALVDTARRTGREYAAPPAELTRFLMAGLDGLCVGLLMESGGGMPGPETRRALDQLVASTITLAYGGKVEPATAP